MPEPGEPRRTMGPWKKSLPVTVGHKNETVPKILVNVLIAFRGGFRIKMAHLCICRSALSQYSFANSRHASSVSTHLLAD